MKKWLSILLFIGISCVNHEQSNIEKAEAAVKKYMAESLNDPKSYEIVHTSLDSVLNPKFEGWFIHQKFRSKNSFGAVVLDEITFRASPDFGYIHHLTYEDLRKQKAELLKKEQQAIDSINKSNLPHLDSL